jgi:hypothetical protein
VEAGCGKRKGRGEEGFEDVGGERQCGGWLPPAGEVEELWPVVGWSTRTRFTGEWNQRGWQGKVYITPQLLGVDYLTPQRMKWSLSSLNFSKPVKLPYRVVLKNHNKS